MSNQELKDKFANYYANLLIAQYQGKPKARALIETIAKAAIAVGADGLFIETHPDPANAKSDGANMLHLDLLEDLMIKLIRIRKAIS